VSEFSKTRKEGSQKMKLFERLFDRTNTPPVADLPAQIALAEHERAELAAELVLEEQRFLNGKLTSDAYSSRRRELADRIELMDGVLAKLLAEVADRERLARQVEEESRSAKLLAKRREIAGRLLASAMEFDSQAGRMAAILAEMHAATVELSAAGMHEHNRVLLPANIAFALRAANLHQYFGLEDSTTNHAKRPLSEIMRARIGNLIA
jgi:hypothetical protein